MPVVPPPSTYEVGGPSTAAAKGLSFTLPATGFPVPPSVIEDLSTCMGNLEYEHEQLMKKVIQVSDAEVVDGITIGEIGLRVSAIEGWVQVMASQMVQAVDRLEQLQTMVFEMSSCESTLMQCIIGMDRRLADLERRAPGPWESYWKNHAMSDKSSPFKMSSFGKLFELDFSKEKGVFTPATDSYASNLTPIDCMERVLCSVKVQLDGYAHPKGLL
nr:hypothetical protein [Tanacetum cinerariifolium]